MSWETQPNTSWKPQAIDKVKNTTKYPAIISVVLGDGKVKLFGGNQLKAADGETLFPGNTKTQVFVAQNGPDHTPHIGFTLLLDHGELRGSGSTATYFDVSMPEIKPTTTYKLPIAGPLKKATITAASLDSGTDAGKLVTLPRNAVHQSIIDANNKGLFLFMASSSTVACANTNKTGANLVPIAIYWQGDKTSFGVVTYPRGVAKGPNYGIVHEDEPFDGDVTLSQILTSTFMIVYLPQNRRESILEAVSKGRAADPIPPLETYGIERM